MVRALFLSSDVAGTSNLKFAGQYYDAETGLHYNYHRYYDPTTGRYLRADPIGLAGGLNLFSYTFNNPIIYIDPLGNEVFLDDKELWFPYEPPNQGSDWNYSWYAGPGFDFSDSWVECCENDKKVKYNIVTMCAGIGFGTTIAVPFSLPSDQASVPDSNKCSNLGDQWYLGKSKSFYAGYGGGYNISFGRDGIPITATGSRGWGVGGEIVVIKICNESVFQKIITDECCNN